MLRKVETKNQSIIIHWDDDMTKNKLKKVREKRLMSKTELAKMAGVSPITIGRIELGFPCRMETQRKILKALGFKLSDRSLVFPQG